jgi:hypothetical protein
VQHIHADVLQMPACLSSMRPATCAYAARHCILKLRTGLVGIVIALGLLEVVIGRHLKVRYITIVNASIISGGSLHSANIATRFGTEMPASAGGLDKCCLRMLRTTQHCAPEGLHALA